MARFGAVLDACVLVPIGLTDTILTIAETELFQPLWSERILKETLDALTEIYPKRNPRVFDERLERMYATFPFANVTDWEHLELGLMRLLPDPDDAHVVSVAIQGRAEVIVTSNLKDFPVEVLQVFNLHAISPDDFLLDLLDLNPTLVIESIYRQSSRTSRPEFNVQEILNSLNTAAPNFALAVGQRLKR